MSLLHAHRTVMIGTGSYDSKKPFRITPYTVGPYRSSFAVHIAQPLVQLGTICCHEISVMHMMYANALVASLACH